MNLSKKFNLHFVGIGGIGMSGIAEIFLAQGHEVSGSDLVNNDVTERLVKMGAEIYSGHFRENIKSPDVMVISSAIRSDNPEVVEARRRGIPVIQRAELLAEIMRGKIGIALAGTHGKTTTTSMTAQILIAAGFDPTVVVGGKVEAIGSNAKVGLGTTVVVEADESDGSFALLPATYSVITNIDQDHMEYFKTKENLHDAFVQFLKKTPFYGCNWLCIEDAGVQEILDRLTKPYFTYGLSDRADLFATNLSVVAGGTQQFELWRRLHRDQPHELLGTVNLGVLGVHNVLNCLGAIGIALSLGVSFTVAANALKSFRHVRRRFDERYYAPSTGIRVIDDYGHHPTEIRAVLSTARQTGHSRIVTIFQPHRYSRTKLCWDDFLTCFKETDVLLMLPIYAASEDPMEGITSSKLLSDMKKSIGNAVQTLEVSSLDEAKEWIVRNKKAGDLILTLGAGSITKLSDELARSL